MSSTVSGVTMEESALLERVSELSLEPNPFSSRTVKSEPEGANGIADQITIAEARAQGRSGQAAP